MTYMELCAYLAEPAYGPPVGDPPEWAAWVHSGLYAAVWCEAVAW